MKKKRKRPLTYSELLSKTFSNVSLTMSRTSKTKVHLAADGTEFVSVTIKLPRLIHDQMERVIKEEDTDRSKFIRRSVVDRLKEEFHVNMEPEAA